MKTPGPLRLVRGGPGNSPAIYTSLDLWYSCRRVDVRLTEFRGPTVAVLKYHFPDSFTAVDTIVPAGKGSVITHRTKSTLESNGCHTTRGGVDQYLACAFARCRALQHSRHSDDLSGAGCWHFAQIPRGFPFMWVRRLRGIKSATGLSQSVSSLVRGGFPCTRLYLLSVDFRSYRPPCFCGAGCPPAGDHGHYPI